MALDLSFGLGYSPVLWSVYTVCAISLCYYIGVSNGHLYPYVPSVSHTGASSPERNIFSMLLEFGAFWAFVNIVVRYLQVKILIARVALDVESLLLKLINKVSFCFGFLSGLGLVIIANWPSPNIIYAYVNHVTTFGSSRFSPSAAKKRPFEMALNFTRGLGFLPVLWGFYTVATIILCYSLAVKHGHLYPYVPSVSHTGATSPERNIFALLFEFGAFWAMVNLSVRYLQFDSLLKAEHNCAKILNKVAFGFGLLSVIGLVFTANWPTPNYPDKHPTMAAIHDSGTVILFVSAGIYFWFQTALTYKLWRLGLNSTVLFALRLTLVCLYTVAFITFVAPERVALKERNQSTDGIKHSIGQWRPGDPGYLLRIIGDIAEWTTVFTLGAFFMTFFSEFQKVAISVSCHDKQEGTGDEYKAGSALYTTLKGADESDREEAKTEY